MSGELDSQCTVTVRLIRSFEHRNIRNLIIHNVKLDQTVNEFMGLVNEKLKSSVNFPPPFRTYEFDTFKIETQAYGFKTNDPVINREDDAKLILKDDCLLKNCGVRHETEISFFKKEDYLKYKENPILVW